jgi:integrase
MLHLSPPTLTQAEQRAILRATAGNARDHLIYRLALATGLTLVEVAGMNFDDVHRPDDINFPPVQLNRVPSRTRCPGRSHDLVR